MRSSCLSRLARALCCLRLFGGYGANCITATTLICSQKVLIAIWVSIYFEQVRARRQLWYYTSVIWRGLPNQQHFTPYVLTKSSKNGRRSELVSLFAAPSIKTSPLRKIIGGIVAEVKAPAQNIPDMRRVASVGVTGFG